MKSHEFIQAAASMIGALSGEQEAAPIQPNRAVLTPAEAELDDTSEKTTMIAPLQQKLELLKKAVDVDSYYDDQDDSAVEVDVVPGEVDPMDDMKRLAGIVFNAEEDSDGLEG